MKRVIAQSLAIALAVSSLPLSAAVKYFNLATDVIPQIKNHLYVIQQHIIRFFFGK